MPISWKLKLLSLFIGFCFQEDELKNTEKSVDLDTLRSQVTTQQKEKETRRRKEEAWVSSVKINFSCL